MLKIDYILYEKKLSRRELSKISNVPYSCIADICSQKSDIRNISFGNALKLSIALKIKVEEVATLQDKYEFDVFRSDIQHEVKRKGQLKFLLDVLESNRIHDLFKFNLKTEALYLVATVDYLSRLNNLSLTNSLNKYRIIKCSKTIFPSDLAISSKKEKDKAIRKSIPEFMNYNIVEVDFFNVI